MFAVGAGCAKLWHWGVLLISKSPQSYSGIIVEAHIIIIPIPAFRNDNMLIDGVLSVSFYWQKKKKNKVFWKHMTGLSFVSCSPLKNEITQWRCNEWDPRCTLFLSPIQKKPVPLIFTSCNLYFTV